MASIHRQKGKPHWFCSYSTGTGLDRKRHFKSTKTADKKAALEICRTWERTAKIGGAGKLTPETAREIVARGVADIFTAVNSETMPNASVRTWCRQWLDAKQIEAEPSTVARYEGIIEQFTAFLETKADRDIASIRPSDVSRFRDEQARVLSRNTANLGVKVLRACFNAAFKQGLLTSNPATSVDRLKQRGECKRRAFTLAELRRVLDAVEGSDWYGATLTGIYTGARLSDMARLTWRAVDLQQNTVAFVAKKTGKRMLVPLAKPLAEHLASLPSTDDPNAPLFPSLAKLSTSQLSNSFRDVLAAIGMADARSHKAVGSGRNAARPVAELSFHSLRHSFVSILKSTGANEAVAMALAGHETKAISQNYTHLDTATLRGAMDKMTDVTKTALADKGKHG
jgi:integrase